MGRVVDDESGNDEEQVDAAATAGENERHDAFSDLVPFRGNAPSMKGNHRKGRNESEDLDVGKHRLPSRANGSPSGVFRGDGSANQMFPAIGTNSRQH